MDTRLKIMDLRHLALLLLPLSALALPGPGGAEPKKSPLVALGCESPPLYSYWGAYNKELVVAFSLEGYYAHVRQRLPQDLYEVIVASSRTALQKANVGRSNLNDRIYLTTQDRVAKVEAAFTGELERQLGDRAGIDRCIMDVSYLFQTLDAHYVLRVHDATSRDSAPPLGELDGTNHTLLAYISLVPQEKLSASRCSVTYQSNSQSVSVCK
jgi:hypothetical protein